MKKREMIVPGIALAVCAAFVLMTASSPPRAEKGADDVSGVWVLEERVDASTCTIDPIGTRRGLLLTIEQGPPAKDGTSKLVVNSEGPTQYSAYVGRYDLADAELSVTAIEGKKNISATSILEAKVKTSGGDRMEGTRNVKIVESKKGKPHSSCKILTSFTARRL